MSPSGGESAIAAGGSEALEASLLEASLDSGPRSEPNLYDVPDAAAVEVDGQETEFEMLYFGDDFESGPLVSA